MTDLHNHVSAGIASVLKKHLKIGGYDAWEGHYYFVDDIDATAKELASVLERDAALARLSAGSRDDLAGRLRRYAASSDDFTAEEFGLLLDAATALSSTEPQTAWQPIETAPRDATSVLIATDIHGTGEAWFSERDDKWHWQTGDPVLAKPTHWQPLPASPMTRPLLCAHGVKIGNTCVGCMGAATLSSQEQK